MGNNKNGFLILTDQGAAYFRLETT